MTPKPARRDRRWRGCDRADADAAVVVTPPTPWPWPRPCRWRRRRGRDGAGADTAVVRDAAAATDRGCRIFWKTSRA